MAMKSAWQEKIEQYCEAFNVPLIHIAEILNEPKVIPMIRGKGFEYTVLSTLQEVLPNNEWKVHKISMSEEAAFHDTDVRVFHKRSGKSVRVECKLAGQESFRLFKDNHVQIKVKCMRSRTLGEAKVKELAPKLGLDEETLSIHNDQYVPADFDVVVTSIGNAFYSTEKETGTYLWKPTAVGEAFLKSLKHSIGQNLRDAAYNMIFVAKTRDLAAKPENGVICSRKKCKNNTSCGFIPNYPVIRFDPGSNKPSKPWVPIEESVNLFKGFITL